MGRLPAREPCQVDGDGGTSRDLRCVDNVVQAEEPAGAVPSEAADRVYDVAVGERTTPNPPVRMICGGPWRRSLAAPCAQPRKPRGW